MAQKFYNESDIQAIASAIRAKNGLSNTYKVSQMASAIQDIPSGSEGNTDAEDGLITKTLSVYENSRVTTIGSYAFCYYKNLISVSFPQVSQIGSYAFQSCSALTSVSFPQARLIDSYAFKSCSALTSISFPQVTSIGTDAFYSCNHLTSVNFPQASNIGNEAFADCSALTSTSFPQVTSIGRIAFYYCIHLTSISLPQVTTLSMGVFSNCQNLTSVFLGGEQSRQGQIDRQCFYCCQKLIDLTLSGSYLYSLSNSNAFSSTPIGGYSASAGQYGSIYVPAGLYSNYISATNWAYFSSRIVSF